MKILINKVILLISILLIIAAYSNAQISIDKTDMPSTGNMVRTSTGLNLDFIDYKETGENYVWDFSELTPISQSVDTFISLIETHIIYWAVFSDYANMAIHKSNQIPIPEFPITDSYTFYNNTNNYYGNAGEGIVLYGIPIPLRFNTTDKLYHFPMNYGNTGSSYAEYHQGLDNFGYIRKEVSRTNTVDGWGTLTTPYGTFDVLRLKSEVVEFDSIYIDSLGMGLPINREYTEYSWLGKGQKLPLLKIQSSFGGAIVTYVDSVRNTPSGITSYSIFNENFNIYPVPSHGTINISFSTQSKCAVEVTIYNSAGAYVNEITEYYHSPGTANIEINLRQFGLNNGIYFLHIKSGTQSVTKKVILH